MTNFSTTYLRSGGNCCVPLLPLTASSLCSIKPVAPHSCPCEFMRRIAASYSLFVVGISDKGGDAGDLSGACTTWILAEVSSGVVLIVDGRDFKAILLKTFAAPVAIYLLLLLLLLWPEALASVADEFVCFLCICGGGELRMNLF